MLFGVSFFRYINIYADLKRLELVSNKFLSLEEWMNSGVRSVEYLKDANLLRIKFNWGQIILFLKFIHIRFFGLTWYSFPLEFFCPPIVHVLVVGQSSLVDFQFQRRLTPICFTVKLSCPLSEVKRLDLRVKVRGWRRVQIICVWKSR